jgi:carbamoyltransferase
MHDRYLGLSGLPGLDPIPAKHILAYASRHPEVGLALGDLGHDAAAVLVEDGRVRFAVEEERLNRSKHFMGFPRAAVERCCREAGVEVDAMRLLYYLDPSAEKKRRRVEACARFLDESGARAVEREFGEVERLVATGREVWPRLECVDHHLAHAASAFYVSGFERALVLVIDGQGELASTSLFVGGDGGLERVAAWSVTSSLGYLYSNVTAYLGFEPVEDEYKIMGLAAYGGEVDEYRAFFDETMREDGDGGIVIPSLLDRPMKRLRDWSRALGAPRRPDTPIEPRHIAIACSLQRALERTVLRLLERHEANLKTGHLCLAGGVALNCSMNGVIDRTGLFREIFVQPAAGDPGAALGSALLAYHQDHVDAPRPRLDDVYFGPSFTQSEVERALESFRGRIDWTRPADYTGEVARQIAAGQVIGWFQGRMEFGPRALGNRSILADPRRADMKDRVNQAVKKREEFRPFAPSVTAEGAADFFELRERRQYEFMTIAVRARAERRDSIPAVVHVNGTARVHIVRREVNPAYWELLTRLGQETGVPVVLNTSFNVRGEPIVCTPEDAVRCFLGTGIDALAIEGYLVSKRPA